MKNCGKKEKRNSSSFNMLFTPLISASYHYLLKPILFLFDPEKVHDLLTFTGEMMEKDDWLVGGLFRFQSKRLHKTVLGVHFDNSVGLAAGFDYNGHMAQVMHSVGFGFNTVGTVTAHAYEGNSYPRLGRLPKSKSLMVNKGFKSGGAVEVAARLDAKDFSRSTLGISVGSSNIPEVDTVEKAIADYLFTFKLFANKSYVKYFELNISCPNTKMPTPFSHPTNFKKLTASVQKLHLKQPIFVKMPNEISFAQCDELIQIALDHGIKGFVFSNLVKDRTNPKLDPEEIKAWEGMKGNFSGAPTFANSNKLIAHARKKFGGHIAIIGTGGIFSPKEAKIKLDAGADLVQLITGMIFEGPQLIGEINKELSHS